MCQAQGSHNVSGPGWLQSHGVMACSGLRAHPVSQHSLAAHRVSWCGCLVTGVTALRGAVTKCHAVHPVPLPGVAVVPRCHDMQWLCVPAVPRCPGLGGSVPWCHRVSLGHCPPTSRCEVAVTTCPHCHGPPGARLARGSCLLVPARIPPPPRSRPCCGQSGGGCSLALSPPFLPGRYRGWPRAWTGNGVGALPGPVRQRPGRAGPRRTEPNRTESSAAEPSREKPNRDDLSQAKPKEAERAAPNQAGPNRAGPNLPDLPRAQPSGTEPEPNAAEPSRSFPSSAERSRA